MTARLPSLESLRFFEACARHRSFSKAAAELGVSPGAVSQRMRDLQAEIATPLFVRKGPRVALTDAGERLADNMHEIMMSLRSAVATCRKDRMLRLTVTPTFATRWLAPRLQSYQTQERSVALSVDVSTELRPIPSFDLAIRSGNGKWPGFEVAKLFEVEATPLVSPRIAGCRELARASELLECPLLPDREWPRWFRAAGIKLPRARRDLTRECFPTQDLTAAAALDGAGVALLSPRLFAREIAAGRFVQPFTKVLRGPEAYWLLTPSDEARAYVLRFRDWLLNAVGRDAS
jgi:LysR family transcriptional regulator, glycine cleavage system transcriptional activator